MTDTRIAATVPGAGKRPGDRAYECPSCGASVVTLASSCPLCGDPLDRVVVDTDGLEFWRGLLTAMAILLAAAVVIAALVALPMWP